MRILNHLTLKHLKMNPKRTIVTIIGIILSMALMLGCGLLASSFIEAMKEETIHDEGSYHVKFQNLSVRDAKTIAANLNVDRTYFYSYVGFANFEESQNNGKPYFFLAAASSDLLETHHLKEGRLPENKHEVVVSDHIYLNGGKEVHVGDVLSLEVGNRVQDGEIVYDNVSYQEGLGDTLIHTKKEEYQVVGIISRSYTEDYSAAGYTLFTVSETYDEVNPNYLFVEYKKPKKTFELSKEIRSNLNLDSGQVQYNDPLLYYYGTSRYRNINQSIMSVLCIALFLLSIGCIIVIYNSFAISTMERKKQFGLYASIGATRSQILHTVFFEAFVVGTIGIILGILSSFLGIYNVLQILNYLLQNTWEYQFSLVINWIYILVPILFMILVVFFSAFLPARRASRVSPIVAIRENDDIKMPKRKLKTPKIVTKLFGIEGELALKNMKRNKKKYRITVLSLFISIVLFISFSTYLNYGISTMDTIDQFDFDLMITSTKKDASTLYEIQKDPRIDFSYLTIENNASYEIQDDYYTSPFASYFKKYDFEYGFLRLVVMNDQDFSNYAKSVGAANDQPILLNEGQIVQYEEDTRTTYHGKVFEKEVSSLMLCSNDTKEDSKCDKSFSNFFFTEKAPQTFKYAGRDFVTYVFLNDSLYQNVFGISSEESANAIYNLNINSSKYEDLYRELNERYDTHNISIGSPKMELKEEQNIILAIKILLYGFISLVTLIGVTSVFNTIYTSINLRRKEFAMLRSIGLTPKGFNKMILFESLFFGLKSLVYALPVSMIFVILIHNSMSGFAVNDGIIIPWKSIILVIFGVFTVVLLAMGYSVQKIKKENILNAIRDENI